MAGRRRDRDEELVVRARHERERHAAHVAAYGFFPGRGPRRSVAVRPAPLRYWQYHPARPWVFLAVLGALGIWLGVLARLDGVAAMATEAPLVAGLALAVLFLSTGRLTVSDSGLSIDAAGLGRTWSLQVVPRSLVREVRRGAPPAGWPPARRRGGWWPGRTTVAVRYLADGAGREEAIVIRVRDPAAFAAALGRPLR